MTPVIDEVPKERFVLVVPTVPIKLLLEDAEAVSPPVNVIESSVVLLKVTVPVFCKVVASLIVEV